MPEHDPFERRLAEALRAYAAEVPTDVYPLELAASIATAHPHGRRTIWPMVGRPMRPVVTLLLLAALLIAAAIAIVAIGQLLEREALVRVEPSPVTIASPDPGASPPVSQRPTPGGDDPVGVASVGVGGWNGVVVDGRGVAWAWGMGAMSRYDPSTGRVEVLDWGDDPLFATSCCPEPASEGGIWVRGATSEELVRLDVDGRHEALTLPGDSCGIVDDPLVVVCDGTFHARDGAGWRELASGFLGEVRYVAIGPGDIVWVLDDVGALWRGAAGGWVSQALPGPALEPFAIAATPDGSVWVGGASGLDRLIDGAWRRYAAPEVGDADLSSLDVAPDGTLWGIGIAWGATFPPGDRIIAVQLVGDRFTAFEVPIDPASAFGMSPVITASATGVYASVWGALYRFTGSGFEPVDPGPAKRLESVSSIAVDGAGVALVVAGDVGAVDHEPVVYRVADGYEIVGDLGPTNLRTGPDGTVWAIAPSGPQRWTGTRFEPLGPPIGLAAAALGRLPAFAVGPDGMPYLAVGRTCVEDVEGTPVCDTTGERVAHLEGGAWVELPPHPGQASGIEWIAVAPDGAVWVSTGSDADTVSLARFAAGAWQAVTLPERAAGAAPVAAVHGLAFGQGGAVWAVFELEELPDFEWAKVVGRLDGEAWTVYESVDGQGLTAGRGTAYRDVIVGRDGTVWTNSREGIARFDGERWEWAIEGLSGLANLTLGADGSIWAGGRGVYRLTVAEDR